MVKIERNEEMVEQPDLEEERVYMPDGIMSRKLYELIYGFKIIPGISKFNKVTGETTFSLKNDKRKK